MGDFWQGVEFSHLLLETHINKGDLVVDATAGNGYDTIFLAELVGIDGKVYSFDIQKQAIENTRKKVLDKGYEDRISLIEDGHQNIGEYLKNEIKGIVFNLGYLPGADKDIITKKNTTIKALKKGIELLCVGGIIVLVIYTGHSGGQEELEAIKNFSLDLDNKKYNVLNYKFLNQKKSPQILAIIRRR
ncbi:class I SAM-dependent methyltransferase [Natronospora cellulosivora (SeqCode)]